MDNKDNKDNKDNTTPQNVQDEIEFWDEMKNVFFRIKKEMYELIIIDNLFSVDIIDKRGLLGTRKKELLGKLYKFYENSCYDHNDKRNMFRLWAKETWCMSLNATTSLAHMYSEGIGTQQDNKKAVLIYQTICDINPEIQGGAYKDIVSIAHNNLGVAYMAGRGVRKDFEMAHKMLSKAKDLGNVRATANLGKLYLIKDSDIDVDYDEAYKLLNKSYEQGEKYYLSDLINCYENSQSHNSERSSDKLRVLKKELKESKENEIKTINTNLRETKTIQPNEDKDELFNKYKDSGDSKDIEKMETLEKYFMGLRCQSKAEILLEARNRLLKAIDLHNKGMELHKLTKYTEAYEYFKQGSHLGLNVSRFNIGKYYEFGFIGEINLDEAKKIYEDLAEKKMGLATCELGKWYFNGTKIKQDINKGLQLFKRACELECCDAFFIMFNHLDKNNKFPEAFEYYIKGKHLQCKIDLLVSLGREEQNLDNIPIDIILETIKDVYCS